MTQNRFRLAAFAAALALSGGLAVPALAQNEPSLLRGEAMNEGTPIADNIAQAADLSTLFAAVKAAGLTDKLAEAGPFTLFAPQNAAFEKLPPGTVDDLLKPESRDRLTKLLSDHVVPGRLTSADALKMVADGGGSHKVKAPGGEELTLSAENGVLIVTDAKGGAARVTQGDIAQSNGTVQLIDAVLMP